LWKLKTRAAKEEKKVDIDEIKKRMREPEA
jgi:hypothetical protein